jgi:hypothetical protein
MVSKIIDMKKTNKMILCASFFISTLLFAGNNVVLAAGNSTGLLNILQRIKGNQNTAAMAIPQLAVNILSQVTNLVLYLIPVFALIMIMYAGIQYIFSAGNPKKSEAAVKLLNSAVIGFAAFLMLLALWKFITNFIGIDAPIQ